ncbi:MAG: YitT family protein, partial [Candidatus Egerieousia sp.]
DSIIERGISDMNRMQHQLLAAVFGGLVYGVGLGMIFKSRATSGGSDIISMIVNKYFHISMGTAVTIVDGLITLTTVVAFGDWKLPMYSWIIIFIESKMIDLIIEGQPVKTVMIISDEYDKIKPVILNEIGRGATIIPAIGMYKGQEKKIIYTTMTRREMMTLKYKIADIDPYAFINIIDSSDILGRGFRDIKGD